MKVYLVVRDEGYGDRWDYGYYSTYEGAEKRLLELYGKYRENDYCGPRPFEIVPMKCSGGWQIRIQDKNK